MAAATTLGRKRDRASGTTARRRVAGGLGITKLGRPLHERVEIEVIPPLFDFSLGHLEHAKAWQDMGCTHLAIATHNAGETNVDGHLARIAEYQAALRD